MTYKFCAKCWNLIFFQWVNKFNKISTKELIFQKFTNEVSDTAKKKCFRRHNADVRSLISSLEASIVINVTWRFIDGNFDIDATKVCRQRQMFIPSGFDFYQGIERNVCTKSVVFEISQLLVTIFIYLRLSQLPIFRLVISKINDKMKRLG